MPRLSPTRLLYLDIGNRRIGVAVGSEETGIATPLETIERSGDDRSTLLRIKDLALREGAGTILVGDPLNMDGSAGFQAQAARDFAKRLQGAMRQVKVIMVDERLSSFSADEWMDRDNVKSADRKMKRDAYSAAVILLDYLSEQS